MGDSGPNLEGLTKMFYNPVKYKVLPYKNRYNEAQEVAYTGYFIPAYTMWFGEQDKGEIGYDSRGVVDEERAKKYYMDRRALLVNDPKDLMMYKAEYCFTPEEALILEGENKFDKERLSTQLNNIEIHKLFDPPQGITLRFKPTKDDPHLVDRFSEPEFEYDSRSKIKIVELPIKDSNGLIPHNLYVAGIDSIDNDTSTSSGQSDVSEFCIIIFKRMMGITPPKPVAIYKERPKDIRIAFDNAIKLLRMYNCKGLIEATKISLVTYFKEKKCIDLLLRRPRATMPTIRKANPNQYGTPATDDIINHQLDLINDYITDYCEYIEFPELLNELLRYSYANKRKFDIVAAFGMCMLANEDMIGKTIQQSAPQKSQEEIGWYTDEYGYKHFGKIPKQQVIQRNEQFRRAGSWFSRNALLLQVPKEN